MNFTIRKSACLLAALCCLASCTVMGCSDDQSSKNGGNAAETDAPGVEVYAPKVPEDKIDANVPGKDIAAEPAKEIVYEGDKGKVTVKLEKVIELDAAKKSDKRVLLAEMTITNNGTKEIDCSELTHFSAKIDGTENLNTVRDVKAAIDARKYYTRISSELQSFNQQIAAGESLNGYVYMGLPASWKDLELIYIPYKYYSNDTITFKIAEDSITHYTEELDAKTN